MGSHLIIDFKAAYDTIARVKLHDAMSSFGITADNAMLSDNG